MWAKCKECGGEVVFDAWARLDGTIHSVFENNICTECDGRVVDYDKVNEERDIENLD